MSAWYMNELLLRLLPREDPHPVLYEAYDVALQRLALQRSAASALRHFEWILLNETGYGIEDEVPDFDDPSIEPALRQSLCVRLNELLGRTFLTRKEIGRASWRE